jgi:hypothetical protein
VLQHINVSANVGNVPGDPDLTMIFTLVAARMLLDQDSNFKSAPPNIKKRIQSSVEKLSASEGHFTTESIT